MKNRIGFRLLHGFELLVTPVPKYLIYLYGTDYQKYFDDVKNVLEGKKKNYVIVGYDFIQYPWSMI